MYGAFTYIYHVDMNLKKTVGKYIIDMDMDGKGLELHPQNLWENRSNSILSVGEAGCFQKASMLFHMLVALGG